MPVFILKKQLPNAEPGTRLFLQDDVYYMKTTTEHDHWYYRHEVEGNTEWFEEEKPQPHEPSSTN